MRPLSEDLRRRIIKAREAGEGSGEVSERFRVSRKSVARFWKLYSLSGHVQPKPIGGYRRSRLEKHDGALKRWIAQQADMTLGEMQARCLEELGVQIGINALWHRLDRLGLSYKKNDARRRARPA
jgi:transposase